MDYETTGVVRARRLTPEEAREQLRLTAERVELGALFRGGGLKVTIAALGIGLILGVSPAARRAAAQGLSAVIRQVRAVQGRRV